MLVVDRMMSYRWTLLMAATSVSVKMLRSNRGEVKGNVKVALGLRTLHLHMQNFKHTF